MYIASLRTASGQVIKNTDASVEYIRAPIMADGNRNPDNPWTWCRVVCVDGSVIVINPNRVESIAYAKYTENRSDDNGTGNQ